MSDESVSQLNSGFSKDIPAPKGDYSGWLRKLGGKFKTWRKRYFVLRGTKLSYYTGSDELRLLGEFSLEYTVVEALNGETDSNGDNKGYLFVVKPDDPSALLTPTHQQFLLSASSPEERKSWIRAIRKALHLKDGGALFGTHLSEAFPFTKPEHGYHPRVVFDTTQFIRQYGLDTEGVFRKCGTQHALQELAEAYDVAAPDPILIPQEHSVHLVAGLLKYYLRELPEPVIPFRFYDQIKSSGFRIADGQDLAPLIDILEGMPAPNYHLLQFLCQFLYEVAQHESTNRMSIENLASVFAPNILRQADGDLDEEMSASSILNLTVAEFIRHHDRLFRLELVSLKQMHSGSTWIPHPPFPRRRGRKHVTADHITLSSAGKTDQLVTGYPDVIDPAFKVHKELTVSNHEASTESSPYSQGSKDRCFGSSYENRSLKWDAQNVGRDLSNHVTVSVAPMQNNVAPPALVTSLHLSTPRSQRSCLGHHLAQSIVAGEDECEDGYSTPTTTATLSSEVINSASGYSAGSLKLHRGDKHLQSSGFISCYDWPTQQSIGTRSPQSNSKLSGSEQLERRSKPLSTWSPGQRDRMHRTSSYDGQCQVTPRRHSSLANQNQARREQERIEMPPKPPPFTLTWNNSRLAMEPGSPVYSPRVIRCAQEQQTPTNNTTIPYTTAGLGHSNSTHEFDTPGRLLPDDQIRYWRALAVSSRADAASQRARTLSLTGELSRTQCDLKMAKLEIRLLRQRLAAAEAELQHHYQFGLVPAMNQSVWANGWNTR